MVGQVLELIAEGLTWDMIIEQCHNSISREAIAEAVQLANTVFLDHAHEYLQPVPK